MASGLYGALLVALMLGLTKFLPQPSGAVIFWGLVCLQLASGAVTCWRRTGLAFATAAMISGSLMSAGVVTLAFMGQPFPHLAPASWVLVGFEAAIGPLFMFIESRVNPTEWAEWQRRMEDKTPWDILVGRHIPHLRKSGA